jgi:hypothetical protein
MAAQVLSASELTDFERHGFIQTNIAAPLVITAQAAAALKKQLEEAQEREELEQVESEESEESSEESTEEPAEEPVAPPSATASPSWTDAQGNFFYVGSSSSPSNAHSNPLLATMASQMQMTSEQYLAVLQQQRQQLPGPPMEHLQPGTQMPPVPGSEFAPQQLSQGQARQQSAFVAEQDFAMGYHYSGPRSTGQTNDPHGPNGRNNFQQPSYGQHAHPQYRGMQYGYGAPHPQLYDGGYSMGYDMYSQNQMMHAPYGYHGGEYAQPYYTGSPVTSPVNSPSRPRKGRNRKNGGVRQVSTFLSLQLCGIFLCTDAPRCRMARTAGTAGTAGTVTEILLQALHGARSRTTSSSSRGRAVDQSSL